LFTLVFLQTVKLLVLSPTFNNFKLSFLIGVIFPDREKEIKINNIRYEKKIKNKNFFILIKLKFLNGFSIR